MLWLLGDSVKLQKSFQGYGSDEGPLSLFALVAMGMGWLNARLISSIWGIGWSATIPGAAQVLIALSVGWGIGSSLLTAPLLEWYDVFVMVGIVMAGTTTFMIRFDL